MTHKHAHCHREEQSYMEISKPAPDFSGIAVINKEFKPIKLSQYKGNYLVFFFYPLDFTFVCPTEIIEFSEKYSEFKEIGCEVVGVSCDSHYTHLAWINTPRKEGGIGDINYPLLSDKSMKIALSYNVLNKEKGIPYRGLFIIDDKGNLRSSIVNDNQVGRNVDEVLRIVKAFQFSDVNGEVCPVGWKPGGKTIKPNPVAALDYFKTV